MDQFVSVWMKKEKKFQGREFIEIKLSTARENYHSQLVTIRNLFLNLNEYAISPQKVPYITLVTDKYVKRCSTALTYSNYDPLVQFVICVSIFDSCALENICPSRQMVLLRYGRKNGSGLELPYFPSESFYIERGRETSGTRLCLRLGYRGKFLTKLWCCVGGKYNKVIWFYQLG